MNRRNFIGNLLSATSGFMILPGAGRLWKAQHLINPLWVNASHEWRDFYADPFGAPATALKQMLTDFDPIYAMAAASNHLAKTLYHHPEVSEIFQRQLFK